MKPSKTLLSGLLLITLSAAALPVLAQDGVPTREQRMEEALHNYRGSAARGEPPGALERARDAVADSERRAGQAIDRGAQSTRNALDRSGRWAGDKVRAGVAATKRGAARAGHAIGRGTEAVKEKLSP